MCVCVLSFHLLWTSDLWTHQPGRQKVSITTAGENREVFEEMRDIYMYVEATSYIAVLHPIIYQYGFHLIVFLHVYSGRQTTSHKISPPSFCSACLHFSLEKGSAVPFPLSSIVRSNSVYPRHNIRSPLLGHDVRKNTSSFDCAEIRTHVPTPEGFEVTN